MSDEAWEELDAAREASDLYDDRAVTAAWIDRQTFPDLEWIVDGILPEGSGLLVAPPKAGKSWWVANVGLACAAGGVALGRIHVKQRPVLYLALEDGHRRLQSRFRTLMEGQQLPEALEIVTRASSMESMTIVDEFLRRRRSESPLVIIDTYGKIKPPRPVSADAYAYDYMVGSALKARIDEIAGGCMLLVHHTRKSESSDFIDSVSGTQGIAGAADFVIVLARKRHSDEGLLAITGRDVREGEYAIRTEGGRWILDGDDLTEAAKTARVRRDSQNLGDRATEVLGVVNKRAPANHTRAADVAEALGLDNDQARVYLNRLAKADRISKVGVGAYTSVTTVTTVTPLATSADSPGETGWGVTPSAATATVTPPPPALASQDALSVTDITGETGKATS